MGIFYRLFFNIVYLINFSNQFIILSINNPKPCSIQHALFRPRIKSAGNFQLKPLKNQCCLSQASYSNYFTPGGIPISIGIIDFRLKLKIAFIPITTRKPFYSQALFFCFILSEAEGFINKKRK